jgi:hypothetical protein
MKKSMVTTALTFSGYEATEVMAGLTEVLFYGTAAVVAPIQSPHAKENS